MMAKRRRARPSSAAEVAEALRPWAPARSNSAAPPSDGSWATVLDINAALRHEEEAERATAQDGPIKPETRDFVPFGRFVDPDRPDSSDVPIGQLEAEKEPASVEVELMSTRTDMSSDVFNAIPRRSPRPMTRRLKRSTVDTAVVPERPSIVSKLRKKPSKRRRLWHRYRRHPVLTHSAAAILGMIVGLLLT